MACTACSTCIDVIRIARSKCQFWISYYAKAPERVQYKLAVMVHRCLPNRAPRYLVDSCIPVSDVASRQHLHSASQRTTLPDCIAVPTLYIRLSTSSVGGPVARNSLYKSTIDIDTDIISYHVAAAYEVVRVGLGAEGRRRRWNSAHVYQHGTVYRQSHVAEQQGDQSGKTTGDRRPSVSQSVSQ